MKARLSELDALRGIAALMVVFEHYTSRYNDFYRPINFPFKFIYGHFGVQLFFLISGFVIFLTLNKTRHPLDFIISRFSRLYPVYWVSVLLTFTCITIFAAPDPSFIPTLNEALINLTMLQRWLISGRNLDGVYWTLAVELSFYAIMFTLYVTNLLKKIEFLSIIYLGFIISTKIIENYFAITIPNVIKVTLLLDYGNLFIAGIMFYKIINTPKKIHYFILLSCLLTEYYLHSESNILIAIYFVIFYLFTQGKLKFISLKPLLFFGSISYSLYLTHQVIGYILIDNLYRKGLDTPWLLLVIAISSSIALASLLRFYVEKPSQNWIRNRWHRSKKYQAITSTL